MIEKVEFHNFKALRDVSLDLERFTVLVGPNASGKTSVLEGLYCIAEFGRGRTGDDPPLWRISLAERTSGVDGEIRLVGSGEAGSICVRVGPEEASIEARYPSGGFGRSASTAAAYQQGARITAPGVNGLPDFGPTALLRLDANHIAAASYSDEPAPRMGFDGQGVPSVLAYVASNEPHDFMRLQADLRTVVPIFQTMRFPRAKVVRQKTEVIEIDGKEFTRHGAQEYWGNTIEFDMDGAPRIPARMVSEGTLLVLGLFTAIMGPHRPKLVLLDDLDRALHPKAQQSVVWLLRELLKDRPDMQIIATSHSPYLLDHLRPEEVRLTTLRDDGSVAVGRLDQHPEFDKWKEEMTPGEFWSVVGEKWVAEPSAGEKA
jgi:energy-coupling factor transporter ATP-binding protein EcfA2